MAGRNTPEYYPSSGPYTHAAHKLFRAAKNLNEYLPVESGNREICDARRIIEHYEERLKKLGENNEEEIH